MELDTVQRMRHVFFRLTGTTSDDPALTEMGEDTNEVVDIYLTRGARAAQRWMLRMGYGGWRQRSSAITWSGADDTDGGRYAALPSDFLRSFGSSRVSALVEADGDRWGTEIRPDEEQLRGDFYYIRGEQLWITRDASPPSTVYHEYHYEHPEFDGLADGSIDFPMEARPLIVAEAADAAKEENWLPGDRMMELKIARSLQRAREEARHIARPTNQPRRMRAPARHGNRW